MTHGYTHGLMDSMNGLDREEAGGLARPTAHSGCAFGDCWARLVPRRKGELQDLLRKMVNLVDLTVLCYPLLTMAALKSRLSRLGSYEIGKKNEVFDEPFWVVVEDKMRKRVLVETFTDGTRWIDFAVLDGAVEKGEIVFVEV